MAKGGGGEQEEEDDDESKDRVQRKNSKAEAQTFLFQCKSDVIRAATCSPA